MSQNDFAAIAVALKLQADDLVERAENAEILAARIGMTPAVAAHVIAERRLQAELVGKAHTIIKALIPVEAFILLVMRAVRRPQLRLVVDRSSKESSHGG